MDFFKALGNNLNYKDNLQLDASFTVAHVNYDKSPIFGEIDGRNLAKGSRKNSLSSEEKMDDVIGYINSFDGTENDFKKLIEEGA